MAPKLVDFFLFDLHRVIFTIRNCQLRPESSRSHLRSQREVSLNTGNTVRQMPPQEDAGFKKQD